MKKMVRKSLYLTVVLVCSGGVLFSMQPGQMIPNPFASDKRLEDEINKEKPDFNLVVDAIQKGANPNIISEKGETALTLAVKLGDSGAVEKLLGQRSLNPDVIQKDGLTPLMIATGSNRLQIVKLLLAAHANPNASVHGGLTALHLASKSGYKDIVASLLVAGANISALFSGRTPLDVAKNNKHADVVAILEAARSAHVAPPRAAAPAIVKVSAALPSAAVVSVDEKDAHGQTALMRAVKAGDTDLVEVLLDQGANPLLTDSAALSARDYARGNPEILAYIESAIESKSARASAAAHPRAAAASAMSVDERDAHGQTALMRAAIAGDMDFVRVLLDQGANPLIEDSARLSARDYALRSPAMLKAINAHIQSKYS